MIKLENTDIYGWEAAIRGMRNPMNSWHKSDSKMSADAIEEGWSWIGENDLKLMKSLSKAGSDHGKFLRMITVTVDITAPLYWWKEFDTYKVGTVANSCSTMHKIHAKEFTLDDFSCEHLLSLDNHGAGFDYSCPVRNADNKNEVVNGECVLASLEILKLTVDVLNTYRYRFIKTNNKLHWWQMIQLLPSSYNQRRTVQMNYQVLKNMYHARKNHKLDEWHTFCDWIKGLPYSELITGEGEKDDGK